MESEPVSVPRVGRAVVLIAASFLAIAAGGVAYLHPTLSELNTVAPVAHAPYHLAAVDFVSPDVGWVVADFEAGDYAVLHTIDGRASRTSQLSAPTGGTQKYVKFFDTTAGVFALVGTRPVLDRTTDGGRTWTATPALSKRSTVLSWSFVDSGRGWMLADPDTGSRPRLYSTEDGGFTWSD